MTTDEKNRAEKLKDKAESMLSMTDSQPEDLTVEEVKALLHDLRVHQVELELQNEELRRTQVELQEASNNYARLFESAPVGYLTVDHSGRIIQVNNTFAEMVQIDAYKLVRASFFDLLHEKDRAEFIATFRAFYKKPENKSKDIRIVKKGGEAFSARLEGRFHRSGESEGENDGDHDRLLLIVSDITQTKEAELEIKRQKNILQTILDGLTDIVALQKPDHTIISYNKAGYEQLGQPPWRVIGRKCFELIGRNMPCDDCATARALASRQAEAIEKYIPELDRWFQVRAIPVFDNGHGITMIVEQLQDIDQRKTVELALRENEKRYRSLVENSLQGVVVAKNNPVRIIFANQTMFDITGYTPAELTGFGPEQMADLIHPDDRELFFKNFRRRLAGEYIPPRHEYRIRHKTDGARWIELFSSLIDYEGEPASQTVMIDITERKQAEEEHRKLEYELRHAQKMEAVGTLAGGIAHDFNNLLQAISGYTEIIMLDKREADPDFRNLSAIQKATGRAAQLVRQMLLFGRKVEADRKSTDINNEIEQARGILERTIPKMIDIETRSGSRLWSVMADPIQIEQVLLNLGGNAADAMPQGGKIVIESDNIIVDENEPGDIFGIIPGKYVRITFSDTGCGMDKEVLEHIFEPFFTTKDIGKGTGLGLASVYGIVKSHRGFINCYSEPGSGTVFKIYLPARESGEDRVDGHAGTVSQRGTETILLVDDEHAIRDFAARSLQMHGYTVIQAAGGEEALRVYAEKGDHINLVILDIGMPGMGGHACFKELVKRNPHAVVLFSSGYSPNGSTKDLLQSGAAGFIGKPYQMNEMLSYVRSILDEKTK
jgi:PAS domain S-box-containing protein